MTNPVWQPGPPQEAGWFWVEWYNRATGLTDRVFRQFWINVYNLSELMCQDVPVQPGTIKRHAGPVAVPEPVEKEGEG